jgi:hypothetical protein
MAQGLRDLSEAGVANFANLQSDLPPSDMVVVYPNPGSTDAMRPREPPSSLSIHLDQPRYVRAILLRYSTPAQGKESIEVEFSCRAASADVSHDSVEYERTPRHGVAASWVDHKIDELSVSCRCVDGRPRIEKIALLVPAQTTPDELRMGNPFFRFH